jgi:hypothetical protein
MARRFPKLRQVLPVPMQCLTAMLPQHELRQKHPVLLQVSNSMVWLPAKEGIRLLVALPSVPDLLGTRIPPHLSGWRRSRMVVARSKQSFFKSARASSWGMIELTYPDMNEYSDSSNHS